MENLFRVVCPKSEVDNDDARMEEENIWDILILA